jgi:A/G-specific adenine glycosylase
VVYLHKTARIVVDEYGGKIPSDPEELVKLPGIGPYTAGAVACFAFEEYVPFADTNMRRVLHRLFFGVDMPEPVASEKEILSLAATLLPPNRGWKWNQALMEF